MFLLRKRVVAFLLDTMLVFTLAYLLSQVGYMNPYINQDKEATEEYKEVLAELQNESLENISYKDYFSKINKPLYKLNQANMFISIYYLIFFVLYFGLFAYFNKGQTIGKRLVGITIVKQNNNSVPLIIMLLRTMFNGCSMFLGVNFFLLLRLLIMFLGSSMTFTSLYIIISFLSGIMEIALFISLIIHKGEKTLNDMIFKTKAKLINTGNLYKKNL